MPLRFALLSLAFLATLTAPLAAAETVLSVELASDELHEHLAAPPGFQQCVGTKGAVGAGAEVEVCAEGKKGLNAVNVKKA